MEVQIVEGEKRAVSAIAFVVPVHCHEKQGRTRREIRKMIVGQLKSIRDNHDHPDSFHYQQMHDQW